MVGNSNTYLLPAQEGYVLVDAGYPGNAAWFFTMLNYHGLRPNDIKLIVVTHAHFDHVGGLKAIQERSGAPVMVHEWEAPLLAAGKMRMPGANNFFTKMVYAAGSERVELWLRFRACQPDIIISGDRSLADFGLEAQVLHTPGHTPGSLSVVTAEGDAFVGDLTVNYYPFGLGPYLPGGADEPENISSSWRKVLEAGAKRIHPGHGAPFDAEALRIRLESPEMNHLEDDFRRWRQELSRRVRLEQLETQQVEERLRHWREALENRAQAIGRRRFLDADALRAKLDRLEAQPVEERLRQWRQRLEARAKEAVLKERLFNRRRERDKTAVNDKS